MRRGIVSGALRISMTDILPADPRSGMMSRKFVCVNQGSGLILRQASVGSVHITVYSVKILL